MRKYENENCATRFVQKSNEVVCITTACRESKWQDGNELRYVTSRPTRNRHVGFKFFVINDYPITNTCIVVLIYHVCDHSFTLAAL